MAIMGGSDVSMRRASDYGMMKSSLQTELAWTLEIVPFYAVFDYRRGLDGNSYAYDIIYKVPSCHQRSDSIALWLITRMLKCYPG